MVKADKSMRMIPQRLRGCDVKSATCHSEKNETVKTDNTVLEIGWLQNGDRQRQSIHGLYRNN